MKKNMLTVIAIALSAINVILSAVLVFAVVPASNRTTKLVNQVASIINLELEASADEVSDTVDPGNIETYKIEQKMAFNIKRSLDGSDHFAAVDSITLSINKGSKDYEKLKGTIEANENFITDIVSEVVSSYTYDDAISSKEEMKAQVLEKVQEHFKSEFIFSVSLNNLCFQ